MATETRPLRFSFLFLALTASFSVDAVKYSIPPQSTSTLRGGTVILKCAFSGLGASDVINWVGPPNFRVIANNRKVDPKYPRFEIVGDASKYEFHLKIRRARREDEGIYRCSTLGLDPVDATLTVVVPADGPPMISGGDSAILAGGQLLLSCSSRGGHPPPELTWYNGTGRIEAQHDSADGTSGEVTSRRISAKITKWDNGVNMTCVADQGFPTLTPALAASTILAVHYATEVVVPRPSLHVLEGSPANMTCLAEGNPAATITWRKMVDSSQSQGFMSGSSLYLPKVMKDAAGVYQCLADNGVSPVGVGTVSLDVLYPPGIDPSMEQKVTVLYGQDDFSLECLAYGNPKPRIRWRRKDTTLYWENPLRFHRVRYDVEGTYQCVATSDGFPQAIRDADVDVVGRPIMVGKRTGSMMSVISGGIARLSCDVIADPLGDKIAWSWRGTRGQEKDLRSGHNGMTIAETKGGQSKSSALTISMVSKAHEGTYTCKASNMFSTVQRDIKLEVKETSKTLFITIVVAVSVTVLAVIVVSCLLIIKRRGQRHNKKRPALRLKEASRPMPPVPKYVKQTGTIDSGVEDLELQEMDGTLKPRPPRRVNKTDWTSVGLTYSGLVHAASLPPYATIERHQPDGEDGIGFEEEQTPLAVPPKPNLRRLQPTPTSPSGGCGSRPLTTNVDNML
ncbi:kin of IRRE-like protein 2 [Branchiostoma floridae x Branchiostoma belcheri]